MKNTNTCKAITYLIIVLFICSLSIYAIHNRSLEVIDIGESINTHSISNDTIDKNLVVNTPLASSLVSNPINFSGSASGDWFFEGIFPVKVMDDKGNVVGVSVASATEDYMTTSMVSFEGSVAFTTTSQNGFLVFEQDDPSGMNKNKSFKLPIKFK